MNTTNQRTIQLRTPGDKRPPPARKIHLDSSAYRLHSMRASGGDDNCDHDFEPKPILEPDQSAVWSCTRCGRTFKFEAWH
jgi:hypothetical protein